MKPCIYAALLCSAAIAVTSCNKHIYVPNQVNAPLLKERYEFKGSITRPICRAPLPLLTISPLWPVDSIYMDSTI